VVLSRNRAFVNQIVRPPFSKALKRKYYERSGYLKAPRKNARLETSAARPPDLPAGGNDTFYKPFWDYCS